ncbi:ferredoxin-type protein NapF [Azoarcus olearius]|uniref:Ferredoxin-type protein NapF n=1 Tax=Azoarcus sp. (strain BH72) TaxID=418699 RepID=A1KCK4_AZOSB|nr:ferredoxin-type protein NapF [Azoarcus olearius]CAL96560.1 probable ferredoxin-type protein NapF [Azoarcus olearius]
MARRGFLRGRTPPGASPLRPPWAVAEEDFLRQCTRCDACVAACPTQVVVRGGGGYPEIDFARGECSFCTRCVTACAARALQRDDGRTPWTPTLTLGASCIAQHGVECRVCGEACGAGAIRFRPRAGGVALPEVEAARCTGCGACVAPCPVRAISLQMNTMAVMEEGA